MIAQFFLCIFGLALLAIAAEVLVRGSSKLALAWGVPPLIIGLTIVAFGTSAPELIVSIQASLRGQSQIVLGNVIGSNIANLAFILGFIAVLRPLNVEATIMRKDLPILILLTLLCSGAFLWTGVNIYGGIFLVLVIGSYVLSLKRGEVLKDPLLKVELKATAERATHKHRATFVNIVFVIGGLLGLAYGGGLLIDNAVLIAEAFKVPPFIIGITLVAVGTSLPELAVCIAAAFRDEADIAIGNLIGSGIFNLTAVLGVAAILKPIPASFNSGASPLDILALCFITLLCYPILKSGTTITRYEGAILLLTYVVYLVLRLS